MLMPKKRQCTKPFIFWAKLSNPNRLTYDKLVDNPEAEPEVAEADFVAEQRPEAARQKL